MSSLDDLVALGIIRKAHGVRGEASVESWTNDPARFEDVSRCILVSPGRDESVEREVESFRVHGSRVLLKFDGVDTPERVAELRDWTVEIPLSERRDLEEDEYWLDDLPGMRVSDAEGTSLGVIRSAAEGGGGILLEIEDPGGSSFEVPFVRAFFPVIDTEARTMVAELPEGIVDLERAVDAGTSDRRPPRRSRKRAAAPRFRIDVITIFPDMVRPFLQEGVIARAIEENVLEIRVHDLRDYTSDRHRVTDDAPYGGGAGMVMKAQPILEALDAIESEAADDPHVVYLSPQGRRLTHELAVELAERSHLVLLCGRYEGVDQRVIESRVDQEVSIGDLVVSGGEVPAMLLMDAVSRMVPGVVGDRNSVERDSFYNGLLDHPHYTRPASLNGMDVPEVLLSGHAERIRKWKKRESLRATLEKRPDLIEAAELDEEAREMLGSLREGDDTQSQER